MSPRKAWLAVSAVILLLAISCVFFLCLHTPSSVQPASLLLSDSSIAESINRRIQRDSLLRTQGLDVQVDNGALTLRGPADSQAMRAYATELFRNEPGVRLIANEMEITRPTQSSAKRQQTLVSSGYIDTPVIRNATTSTTSAAESSDIEAAFQSWRLALLSNNPHLQAQPYADHIHRYFLASDWSRSQLEDYLRRFDSRSSFRDVEVSDVNYEPESDGSTGVSFMKHFSVQGNGVVTTAVVRSVLHFVRENGELKINYERDFKN